ncbi:MAG: methyltransferase domain-containing protein [Pseudomonadota bacterium]
MTTQCLIDRRLFQRRLARAARLGDRQALFLLDHVVEELIDRVSMVNRSFETAVDISGWLPDLCDRLVARRVATSAYRLAPFIGNGRPTAVIDDEILPLRDASADLVVSVLNLQFANDVPGILAQIRRALRPDGLFLAALIGGQSLQELRACLTEAELAETGGASPRVAPLAEVRDLGALLQRAGFALPVTDLDRLTVRYTGLTGLVRDLRAMAATNALNDRDIRVPPRMLFPNAAALYADRYGAADGRIPVTFDVMWMSGWAPHDSQQKPLRPGTARTRLADALGTDEITLTDDSKPK